MRLTDDALISNNIMHEASGDDHDDDNGSGGGTAYTHILAVFAHVNYLYSSHFGDGVVVVVVPCAIGASALSNNPQHCPI